MATVNYTRGFTLTEMAIVLMIVGLLIGGMLMPLSAQQEIAQRQKTEAVLAEVREALIGYALANGALPCPAKSPIDGEKKDSCSASDSEATGFVPWSTLGTTKADAWGKLIRYSVTPALTSDITINLTGSKKVKSTETDSTYLAGNLSCTTLAPCPAAIIFSQGKTGEGTTENNVPTTGSVTNTDEKANNTSDTLFYSRSPTPNTAAIGGEFDDIVTWIPITTLFARLSAAGKL